MNSTYEFYNEVEHIGRLAEGAYRILCAGDKAGALELIKIIQDKYGDLFGVGLRLRYAIAELSANP